MRNPTALLLPFLVSLVAAAPGADSSVVLNRLSGKIDLDGFSNEPAWQAIPPLPLVMYEPTFLGTPSESTEIRVAYDSDHLYFSARCYESNPGKIRANSLYRDRYSGDDTFDIILDTFNDNENALWFWTTPTGIRAETTISVDGEGSFNDDWNTFWDVETVENEHGWFAEVRIPFSSLGFQDQDGRVVMGLIVSRFISRNNERLVFPEMQPDRGFFTPSRAQKVVLKGVYSQKPVYVTPYLLSGVGQTPELNRSGNAFYLNENYTRNFGLDVKYNVTSNVTLDVTVNTDFAQVEADDQQVNLSRFSLFFPEKRRFFQERSGIFSFNTIAFGSDRLFHSRRIGIKDQKQIPIIGGARLVGRLGDWDLGFLNMQTARKGDAPSENFGVLRLRRRVINMNSYAGGMATSRLDEDGNYNFAYGLDGTFHLFGEDYLTVKWAQTFEEEVFRRRTFDFTDAAMVRAQWTRRSNVGFNYWLNATRQGQDFFPALGFATRQNFTELGWYLSYDWLMPEHTAFTRISPAQFFGFVALRNGDNSVESGLVEYDTDFYWKSGANLWFDLQVHYEDLSEELLFPETSAVPAGSYTFFRAEGGYGMARGQLLRANLGWAVGTFYDGWRADLEFHPTWNVSRHLELNGQYELNVVRFPNRDQGFNAHILRWQTQVALNTKFSMHAFLQFSSTNNEFVTNLRLRYNFSEGNDFWFVYDENLNTDRDRTVPRLLLTSGRTLLVKYTYTVGL